MLTQPVTPELREWLVAQLRAGFGEAEVVAAMLASGWDEGVAREALSTVLATLPVEPPAVATAGTGGLPAIDLTGSPLRVDAGDRWVDIVVSMTHPQVVVLGNLLSGRECDALIESARPALARSRTVETRTGGEEVNADRTSSGMFFQRGQTPEVTALEARIARLCRWPVSHGEGIQVLHYQPGAEYRPHYDYFDPEEPGTPTILRRGGQRLATLVMYLNEPARGGATTFPDVGLQVAPVRGNAVFFVYDRPHPSTRTLHGGAPVIEGEKWVATKWLREREFT